MAATARPITRTPPTNTRASTPKVPSAKTIAQAGAFGTGTGIGLGAAGLLGSYLFDAYLAAKRDLEGRADDQDSRNVRNAVNIVAQQELGQQRDLEAAQAAADQAIAASASNMTASGVNAAGQTALAAGGGRANVAAAAMANAANAYNQQFVQNQQKALERREEYEKLVPERRQALQANQRQQQEMLNNAMSLHQAATTGDQMELDNLRAQLNPWGSGASTAPFGLVTTRNNTVVQTPNVTPTTVVTGQTGKAADTGATTNTAENTAENTNAKADTKNKSLAEQLLTNWLNKK